MSTPALFGAARAMSRLGVCRGAVRGHELEAEHVMAKINPTRGEDPAPPVAR